MVKVQEKFDEKGEKYETESEKLRLKKLMDTFLQRLLTKKGNVHQRRSEIVPCCSPTQLSPIQLLYVDSNNTITQKTLPNMVVEACGCM